MNTAPITLVTCRCCGSELQAFTAEAALRLAAGSLDAARWELLDMLLKNGPMTLDAILAHPRRRLGVIRGGFSYASLRRSATVVNKSFAEVPDIIMMVSTKVDSEAAQAFLFSTPGSSWDGLPDMQAHVAARDAYLARRADALRKTKPAPKAAPDQV